jgi:hypothetical protein
MKQDSLYIRGVIFFFIFYVPFSQQETPNNSPGVVTSKGIFCVLVYERCRRELQLLAGPPKPVRSRMTEEAKNNPRRKNSDQNSPDAGSSDISSDMKHRTVDG